MQRKPDLDPSSTPCSGRSGAVLTRRALQAVSGPEARCLTQGELAAGVPCKKGLWLDQCSRAGLSGHVDKAFLR